MAILAAASMPPLPTLSFIALLSQYYHRGSARATQDARPKRSRKTVMALFRRCTILFSERRLRGAVLLSTVHLALPAPPCDGWGGQTTAFPLCSYPHERHF